MTAVEIGPATAGPGDDPRVSALAEENQTLREYLKRVLETLEARVEHEEALRAQAAQEAAAAAQALAQAQAATAAAAALAARAEPVTPTLQVVQTHAPEPAPPPPTVVPTAFSGLGHALQLDFEAQPLSGPRSSTELEDSLHRVEQVMEQVVKLLGNTRSAVIVLDD